MIWVKKFYKGKKYTQKLYAVEDFAHLSKGQWVADDSTNKMVNEFITIKLS
jgi:DNA-directed RNA polymerase subunit beta